MELLIRKASAAPTVIIRNLREGPSYQPDWRFRTVEQYLLDVGKAKDKSSQIDALLAREVDPYVRQLLRFHCDWLCLIADPIRYALRCRASNPENRIASLVKATIIAGRTAQQIASDLGADPLGIITFEKLFFDVRRYLARRAWVKSLCFPVYQYQPSAEEECEARWLSAAYLRGWAGLASLISNHKSDQSGKTELGRLVRVLLARSNDYLVGLEAAGVLPTQRDLQFLALVQHRIEGLGLPMKLEDLDYTEPPDAEEEKRQHEAKQAVKGLSAAARRKIIAVLERIRQEQARHSRATPR